MILHTGNRTDIPAFYSKWFAGRLKDGYVLVRSPYNPSLVTRYEINKEVVDLMVFCTKNPSPMLPYMKALSPYSQYWFVTLTPYGNEIEPGIKDKNEVINAFRHLSGIVGPENICWRYDPIFTDKTYTISYHMKAFEKICRLLSGYTNCCIISFLDIYQKVRKNFPEACEVSMQDRLLLGKAIIDIGKRYNIKIKTCAEGTLLADAGADCSGCMTQKVFEDAVGSRLILPKSFRPSRKECSCILSSDIGAYDTCANLCRYCYANSSAEAVIKNLKLHDPASPLLIGHLMPEDKVVQAIQESWIDMQLSFL